MNDDIFIRKVPLDPWAPERAHADEVAALIRERDDALAEAVRLRSALGNYMAGVQVLNDAVQAGTNVHDTIAALVGRHDMACEVLSSTTRSGAFVLVPLEPTEAMVEAGTKPPYPGWEHIAGASIIARWKAMIAALDGTKEMG